MFPTTHKIPPPPRNLNMAEPQPYHQQPQHHHHRGGQKHQQHHDQQQHDFPPNVEFLEVAVGDGAGFITQLPWFRTQGQQQTPAPDTRVAVRLPLPLTRSQRQRRFPPQFPTACAIGRVLRVLGDHEKAAVLHDSSAYRQRLDASTLALYNSKHKTDGTLARCLTLRERTNCAVLRSATESDRTELAAACINAEHQIQDVISDVVEAKLLAVGSDYLVSDQERAALHRLYVLGVSVLAADWTPQNVSVLVVGVNADEEESRRGAESLLGRICEYVLGNVFGAAVEEEQQQQQSLQQQQQDVSVVAATLDKEGEDGAAGAEKEEQQKKQSKSPVRGGVDDNDDDDGAEDDEEDGGADDGDDDDDDDGGEVPLLGNITTSTATDVAAAVTTTDAVGDSDVAVAAGGVGGRDSSVFPRKKVRGGARRGGKNHRRGHNGPMGGNPKPIRDESDFTKVFLHNTVPLVVCPKRAALTLPPEISYGFRWSPFFLATVAEHAGDEAAREMEFPVVVVPAPAPAPVPSLPQFVPSVSGGVTPAVAADDRRRQRGGVDQEDNHFDQQYQRPPQQQQQQQHQQQRHTESADYFASYDDIRAPPPPPPPQQQSLPLSRNSGGGGGGAESRDNFWDDPHQTQQQAPPPSASNNNSGVDPVREYSALLVRALALPTEFQRRLKEDLDASLEAEQRKQRAEQQQQHPYQQQAPQPQQQHHQYRPPSPPRHQPHQQQQQRGGYEYEQRPPPPQPQPQPQQQPHSFQQYDAFEDMYAPPQQQQYQQPQQQQPPRNQALLDHRRETGTVIHFLGGAGKDYGFISRSGDFKGVGDKSKKTDFYFHLDDFMGRHPPPGSVRPGVQLSFVPQLEPKRRATMIKMMGEDARPHGGGGGGAYLAL